VTALTAHPQKSVFEPAARLWHDTDWPAIPGHFAIGWALPLIGAYYRLKDLVQ